MSDLTYIAEGLRPLAVPIESIKPDPANARTHNRRSLDAIGASLSQFGQVKPIAVRRADRVVIAGNGRLAAALALGWTHIAAVLMDGTAQQLAAYALADNKSAELGEWDELALADLVRDVGGEVDLAGLGFTAGELAALGDAEEGEAPEFDPPTENLDDASEPSAAPPSPRAPVKAAPAKPAAKQQRAVAGKKAAADGVTAEEWAVIREAAAALRDEKEDDGLTDGACMRILARRYLKGRGV